ncbi:MAG: hypothetical protein ACYCOY_09340 [Metallibacterium sp.]
MRALPSRPAALLGAGQRYPDQLQLQLQLQRREQSERALAWLLIFIPFGSGGAARDKGILQGHRKNHRSSTTCGASRHNALPARDTAMPPQP